jgi:chemotaxis protein methyltransferase CheR
LIIDKDEIIPLPEDVFRLLRDLVSEFCGIYFDDTSQFILERRLNRRLKINGLDNFRDYYRLLLYDSRRDQELSEIIDVLTVNETYFFREQNQLNAFVEEVCRDLREQRNEIRRLRIWSAGCASGEEPYTIAMLMLEQREQFDNWKIEIIGSDINQRVLQKARRGVFGRNSFRTTDNYYIRKYFTEENGEYRINDSVKTLVTFNYLNLLDPLKVRFVGLMDVVFCRNVLIYFHPDAKKRVIESFYPRLNDGGYLLLGHAESLMNISTAFALKHLNQDMVYQKPKKSVVSMSDENLYRMIWGR